MVIPAFYCGIAIMLGVGALGFGPIYTDLNIRLPRITDTIINYWWIGSLACLALCVISVYHRQFKIRIWHFAIIGALISTAIYGLIIPLIAVDESLNSNGLTSRCTGAHDVFVPTHRYGQEFAATRFNGAVWDLSRRSVLDAPLAIVPIAIHDLRAIHASRQRARRPLSLGRPE